MDPAEYAAAEDEFERLAHQVGVMYARLRRIRGYGAPSIIIDSEQTRLDRLADRLSVVLDQLVKHDVATDDADNDE